MENLKEILEFKDSYSSTIDKKIKICIFNKNSGYRNYIDVSKYFTKVKAVMITPWADYGTAGKDHYTMTYIRTTDDLKIIYKSCILNVDGTITEVVNYNIDEQNFYGSCVFLVVGY